MKNYEEFELKHKLKLGLQLFLSGNGMIGKLSLEYRL